MTQQRWTEADLLSWRDRGDNLNIIFNRALVGNGWGRDKVRQVLGL